MKKNYSFLVILILIVLVIIFLGKNDPQIKTPKKNYEVQIANTEALRVKGLSGTKNLPQNTVMFFDFDKEGYYGIWMKDMLINIDIVFLDKDYNVINFYDDISPNTYPTIYYPESPAMYVIEMASGQRLKSGLDKGSKVYYK